MPTYKFHNKETNKTWTDFMTISECDTFLIENPAIEQMVHGAPMIVSGRPVKPDNGFRDVLRRIKKGNSRGTTSANVNTF